jgi:predicted porin
MSVLATKMMRFSVGGADAAAFCGASALASDLPTKAPAGPATSCFASLYDYMDSSAQECPLTWNGITVYGAIDVGVDYMTHGAPFNGAYPQGVETLISKNSQGARYSIAPNGLGQSVAGIRGTEEITQDWSFVFRLETGFDPYSLQLANGPRSLIENNSSVLANQSSNNDSSRAGQIFNSQAYAGLSNSALGTLTVGRQNSLTLAGVSAYDPMGGSVAFSVIGDSAKTAGVGDTEDARSNTAVKYLTNIGQFRLGGSYQFGGYDQGNGSNGAYEAQIGGDFGGFSVDTIYSSVRDAVSLANWSTTTTVATPAELNTLKATLSNDTSITLLAKYTIGPVKLFAGFEHIRYQNPSDSYANGFTSIGGYTVAANSVLPGSVTFTDYTINKVLQVSWIGAKYSILSNLDIVGAYYRYNQNNYDSSPCTGSGVNTSSSKCAGTQDDASMMIAYRPLKRLTVYGGVMYSQVNGGLASGFLNANNLDATIGLRLEF